MLFDTFDRTGNAEFPFPKQVVFRALCDAIEELKGMEIEIQDVLASRVEVKTGMSAFSWGERVSVSVVENGENGAVVSVQSGAKTIFGSATTHGKNRKNVRKIIHHTSKILEQNGSQWKEEIGLTTSSSEQTSTEQSPRLIADELMKLADLRDKGILSPEEFSKQKTQLLDGGGGFKP